MEKLKCGHCGNETVNKIILEDSFDETDETIKLYARCLKCHNVWSVSEDYQYSEYAHAAADS